MEEEDWKERKIFGGEMRWRECEGRGERRRKRENLYEYLRKMHQYFHCFWTHLRGFQGQK